MIKQKLLTINEFSRPNKTLKKVKAIVLHWIADSKGTPTTVFNWFEQRKKGKTGYGSAHFCVGVDGEALQYLTQEEMSYHVGSKTYTDYGLSLSSYPNNCTIGIEMCHLNWEGEFSEETINKTKMLTALLLQQYNLTSNDITTHQAIVGWKDCPRWFVNNPEDLIIFKQEIHDLMIKGIKGKCLANSLNIRDDIMGEKVGVIGLDWEIEIIGIKNGWYKIKHNDLIGYCNSKYVEII